MRKKSFSKMASLMLAIILCVLGGISASDVQASSSFVDPVSEILKEEEAAQIFDMEDEAENLEEPEDFSWMKQLLEEEQQDSLSNEGTETSSRSPEKTDEDTVTLRLPEEEGRAASDFSEAGSPSVEFGDGSAFSDSSDAFFSDDENEEETGEYLPDELFSTGEPSEGFSDPESGNGTDGEESELGESEAVLHLEEGEDFVTKLNILLYKAKELATDEHPYKVIIPPGNYEMKGTISTYSNIHLYAVGAVIKKVSAKKQILLRLGNSEVSEGGYDGYRNITIEGGTWDCNYESCANKEEPGGFVGFRIGHAANVTIKNVTFLNNLKSHFLELGGVKHALVTGCKFEGYWTPHETSGQECIQIDACLDEIFPRYQPFDGTVCADIVIENNVFRNVFAGAGSHSMIFNKPYTNIVIRNNVFTNVKKGAVGLLNCKDSIVSNNVMKNVGAGITITLMRGTHAHVLEGQTASNKQNQASQKLVISNNKITLSAPCNIAGTLWRGYGIKIAGQKVTKSYYGTPTGSYVIKGVTASGNQISGPGNGIHLDRAARCTISKNKITLSRPKQFTNFGIYLGGSRLNQITGNVIQNAGNAGIYVYTTSSYDYGSSRNEIRSNQVTKCVAQGISIGAKSDYIILEKNTCTNNGQSGIHVKGSIVSSMAYNNATGNGAKGISCYASTIKSQKKNTLQVNASAYAMYFKNCKGQVQSLKKPTIYKVKKGAKKVTGKTSGGTKALVYAAKTNVKLGSAKLTKTWNFSAAVKALKKGTAITVKVTDKYSNIAIAQTKVV